MTENEIANKAIGMAIEIHKLLGPGLLESAYKECLFYKIRKSGLWVEKEKPMPLIFEEVKLDCGYRIDLLIEQKLVIELKSVDALNEFGIKTREASRCQGLKIRKIVTTIPIDSKS
ncbi:MAG: GxxExxY protein [Bacteroidota bacterium]